MKTKRETQKDLPYTVVGHTAIPQPIISILLTAKGIKELAKRMNENDMVDIKEWSDITNEGKDKKHYSRITIIRDK